MGCHSVFIVGDNAGRTVRTTYPTTTAFTIPVGSGACADEIAQPVAQCAGVDGGVGGADASLDSGSGGSDGGSKDSGGGSDGAKGGTDGSPTGSADGAAGDSAGGDASEGNDGGSSTGGEAGTDATLVGMGDDASGLSTGGEGGGVVASDEGGAGGLDATFLGGGLDASMPGFGLIEAGDDAAGPASTKSGCACGVAPTRTSGAWSALAAAGLVFPLRRRRWRRIIASRAS